MEALKRLELDIKSVQKLTLDLATPKNIAIIATSFGLAYISYRTMSVYLTRRKYRHIPGPPTKGSFLNNFF